jgi:flagellar motility protein MotE (MotC chaperone)
MAPILARMMPERAQALTSGLANLEPSIDDAQNASNNAQLPQIVGQ